MPLMLGGINVSALVGRGACMHVCVCSCMSVWPLTLKECISYCVHSIFNGCVCPGCRILTCVPACRVCEITSLTSADLLTLFVSFYTWPPMIKASKEGRCACPLPSQHSSFIGRAAESRRWLVTHDIHLFFLLLAGVMVGKSPNEVYEPIKQAFNLLVYAQELVLLIAFSFLWTAVISMIPQGIRVYLGWSDQ